MTEDRKCGTCRYFDRPMGRDGQTCQDQGEVRTAPACPRYAPEIVNVGALPVPSFREIFKEVLAESFVCEQDLKLAVDEVAAQLHAQGATISLNERGDNHPEFRVTGERLIDLYVVYRLCMTLGLGRYSDQIMEKEIERKFGVRR